MPSSTSVRLTVRGTDQTRAMLAGIRARLGLFASQVRAATATAARGLGVATAAAAGLGAAVVAASRDLSRLGDRAAQAGMTADELTRLSTALNVAGARGADIETIAQGLARMTQATGRAGLAGLRETLAEISQLGDEGARVRELSRVFGRSFGPGLAALVRQGPDALRAGLDGVLAAMPGLRAGLADAADGLADGFQIAKDGVLRGVQSLLVEIGNRIVGGTGLSARQLGATIAAYARYYTDTIAANLDDLPAYVGSLLDEIGARLGHKLREWTGWIGDLVAFMGKGFDFLGGVFDGKGLAQAAADAEAAYAETFEEQIARIRRNRAGLFEATPEARERLKRDLDAARNIEEALSSLTGGNAGAAFAENVGAALAPLRDAQAVLAGSYQAFRIASQRGLGGSNGGIPAERAAQSTAQNTGRMVTSLAQLNATAQKAYAALFGSQPIYVLA